MKNNNNDVDNQRQVRKKNPTNFSAQNILNFILSTGWMSEFSSIALASVVAAVTRNLSLSKMKTND